MNNVVHFNMILEINQLLKENNIEYSIHGVGGCTCCGLELRQEGKSYPTDKILEVINGYLKNHWIYFPMIFLIVFKSLFSISALNI